MNNLVAQAWKCVLYAYSSDTETQGGAKQLSRKRLCYCTQVDEAEGTKCLRLHSIDLNKFSVFFKTEITLGV